MSHTTHVLTSSESERELGATPIKPQWLWAGHKNQEGVTPFQMPSEMSPPAGAVDGTTARVPYRVVVCGKQGKVQQPKMLEHGTPVRGVLSANRDSWVRHLAGTWTKEALLAMEAARGCDACTKATSRTPMSLAKR